MQGVLAECLKAVSRATPALVEDAPAKLEEVEKAIVQANHKLGNLLGFEKTTQPALEAQIIKLKKQRAGLYSVSKCDTYGRLSWEPLRWLDNNGYPKLAVMTLESPLFRISASVHYPGSGHTFVTKIEPKLPKEIADCYQSAVKNLVKKLKEKYRRSSVEAAHLTTEYIGLIPDDTLKRIEEARPYFEEIYFIVEGKEWSLTWQKTRPATQNDGDPIVVGFDGEALWVVDTFDLSSVERFAVSEFTL